MKAHSGEVGVFVRIRPTANFAQDLLQCLPDGQGWYQLYGIKDNIEQQLCGATFLWTSTCFDKATEDRR